MNGPPTQLWHQKNQRETRLILMLEIKSPPTPILEVLALFFLGGGGGGVARGQKFGVRFIHGSG